MKLPSSEANAHAGTGAGGVADNLAELTLRGVLLGAVITILFTASNVYLGLKVGLTFSSAIPSAIISMAVLRSFSGANILEHNMVQTQASAAGTLSSVIFIIPGLLMVGYWKGFPFFETFGLCAAGGLMGVIFTIPLRHAMVVESDLPYPEGVAAAEILRVGEKSRLPSAARAHDAAGIQTDADASAQAGSDASEPGASRAGVADIAIGGVIAAAVSFATTGLRVLADGASAWGSIGLAVFRLPMGFSLALLGAGYLIGIVAGIATLLGVIIAWGIAVPILTAQGTRPADVSLIDYATGIWSNDVRFLGAGIIAIAAVWTLITLAGPVARGMRKAFRGSSRRTGDGGASAEIARTERDLAPRWIAIVMVVVVALLVVLFSVFLSGFPQTPAQRWSLVGYGVLFAVIFGFLISAACGYMAGLIGSSSSPISGIGIIGTILVSLLILLTGRETGLLGTPDGEKLAVAFALFTMSAVLSVAAIANDNLQDLKTGLLVGATPWKQQVALLIGVVVGALAIPPILDLLYQAFGFTGAMPRPGMDASQALSAPQATLMAAIANGIFTHHLNWAMLRAGVIFGVVLIMIDTWLKRRGGVARLPVLAVGIGVYLPPLVSVPLGVGAIIAYIVERVLRQRAARTGQSYDTYAAVPNRRAVLLASGLIVGESLLGVVMAGVIGATGKDAPFAIAGANFATSAQWLGLAVFAAVCVWFYRRILHAAPPAA